MKQYEKKQWSNGNGFKWGGERSIKKKATTGNTGRITKSNSKVATNSGITSRITGGQFNGAGSMMKKATPRKKAGTGSPVSTPGFKPAKTKKTY